MDGVSEYHTTALKNIEIDKRQIAPPPKVRLNKDNISIPQNALLNTFRKDTQNKGNPYNIYLINTVENFIQLCMTEYKNLQRN